MSDSNAVGVEQDHLNTIRERDEAHDAADRLAYSVADQSEIGEHSSGNDPWENALEMITKLREENARLAAALAELQRAATPFSCNVHRSITNDKLKVFIQFEAGGVLAWATVGDVRRLNAALTTDPTSALAAYRKRVLEEAADKLDGYLAALPPAVTPENHDYNAAIRHAVRMVREMAKEGA